MHLVVVEEEQVVIAEVRWLGEQGLSLRAICARLSTAGLAPRSGAWHPQKVARILRRGEAASRSHALNACGDAAPACT